MAAYYYENRAGQKFDRALLAAASIPLTMAAAARIAERLADAAVITTIERDTIQEILRWPAYRRARAFLTAWWEAQTLGEQADELRPGAVDDPKMAAIVGEGAERRAAARDCLRGATPAKPTSKPAAKPEPAAKPAKPASKPAAKPAKPASKPAAKPAKPASKPPAKPAAKPAKSASKPAKARTNQASLF